MTDEELASENKARAKRKPKAQSSDNPVPLAFHYKNHAAGFKLMWSSLRPEFQQVIDDASCRRFVIMLERFGVPVHAET